MGFQQQWRLEKPHMMVRCCHGFQGWTESGLKDIGVCSCSLLQHGIVISILGLEHRLLRLSIQSKSSSESLHLIAKCWRPNWDIYLRRSLVECSRNLKHLNVGFCHGLSETMLMRIFQELKLQQMNVTQCRGVSMSTRFWCVLFTCTLWHKHSGLFRDCARECRDVFKSPSSWKLPIADTFLDQHRTWFWCLLFAHALWDKRSGSFSQSYAMRKKDGCVSFASESLWAVSLLGKRRKRLQLLNHLHTICQQSDDSSFELCTLNMIGPFFLRDFLKRLLIESTGIRRKSFTQNLHSLQVRWPFYFRLWLPHGLIFWQAHGWITWRARVIMWPEPSVQVPLARHQYFVQKGKTSYDVFPKEWGVWLGYQMNTQKFIRIIRPDYQKKTQRSFRSQKSVSSSTCMQSAKKVTIVLWILTGSWLELQMENAGLNVESSSSDASWCWEPCHTRSRHRVCIVVDRGWRLGYRMHCQTVDELNIFDFRYHIWMPHTEYVHLHFGVHCNDYFVQVY